MDTERSHHHILRRLGRHVGTGLLLFLAAHRCLAACCLWVPLQVQQKRWPVEEPPGPRGLETRV